MNTIDKYQKYYDKIQAVAQGQAAAIDESMVKESSSFAALRKKGATLYAAWAKDYEDMENAVNAVLAERNYSDFYKNNEVARVRAVYEESMGKLVKEFKDCVESTLAVKEAALNKMFTGAPSQEQLNLLQALQLREDELDEEEVLRIACELASNYNAIKALHKIASKAGCGFVLPELYNADVLIERFAWVKNYLNDRCHDMGMLWKQMSFDGRCFFGTEWEDANYENNAVEIFDKHNALNLQGAKVLPESENSNHLTDDERATLNAMFGGIRRSSDLEVAVLQVVTENPSLAKAIAKHDVYKNFLPNNRKVENK